MSTQLTPKQLERKNELEYAYQKLPTDERLKIHVLVDWSHDNIRALGKLHIIQEEYVQFILQQKENRVLLSDCADLLNIRKSDLTRWEKDQRFPNPSYINLYIGNKYRRCRAWTMLDVNYAAQYVEEWILSDIEKKKITCTKKVTEMIEKIRQKKGIAPSDRLHLLPEERKMASHEKGRQRERKIKAREQKLQEISECFRTSHHWSDFHDNPELGNRHIEAYIGPTNSGKTWRAIQYLTDLLPSQTGVYLAPLRLLAMEVCDELRGKGLSVSLITGDEQDIVKNSHITCSTIEMLNTENYYDIAVIDEMQMIADKQRGYAWTNAIMELQAKKIVILGSSGVETFLREYCENSGDILAIIHTQRFNELRLAEKNIKPKDVPNNSIFVVFSRKSVIQWGQYFRGQHKKVSLIYGAMPPEVRREEARRIRTGEAQILVATDAVAMGLNLPVQHVIIGEQRKFDGNTLISIPKSLIRQIAGRAGRYGMHEYGLVAGADIDIHEDVKLGMETADKAIHFAKIPLTPTRKWIRKIEEDFPNTTILELLDTWDLVMKTSKWFQSNLEDLRGKANILIKIKGIKKLSLVDQMQLITAPVENKEEYLSLFEEMVRSVLSKSHEPAPTVEQEKFVEELESLYKNVTLYLWFHYRYPSIFTDKEGALDTKRACVIGIRNRLKKGLKRHCNRCGCILRYNHKYNICDSCYMIGQICY